MKIFSLQTRITANHLHVKLDSVQLKTDSRSYNLWYQLWESALSVSKISPETTDGLSSESKQSQVLRVLGSWLHSSIWGTLGVFEFLWRKRADPFLRTSQTLVPAVEGSVLEVSLSFVGLDREGGAGHSQGVAVQQRGVVADRTEQPAQEVVEHGQEPEDHRRHAHLPEVEGGQQAHVEVLVAFVRRLVVAEERFAADPLRVVPEGSGCEDVHPGDVTWRRKHTQNRAGRRSSF